MVVLDYVAIFLLLLPLHKKRLSAANYAGLDRYNGEKDAGRGKLMNDKTTSLCELKTMMADFVRQRDWEKYHQPKNLAMSIAVETAELMELFQWHDHEEVKTFLSNSTNRKLVAHEMADVLAFLLSLSNVTGIDLAASFEEKMAHNAKKYPAEKMKGHYKRPARAAKA
ncbi:MAG: nucleotide pyrophosphohydrolase [bacterium]